MQYVLSELGFGENCWNTIFLYVIQNSHDGLGSYVTTMSRYECRELPTVLPNKITIRVVEGYQVPVLRGHLA